MNGSFIFNYLNGFMQMQLLFLCVDSLFFLVSPGNNEYNLLFPWTAEHETTKTDQ